MILFEDIEKYIEPYYKKRSKLLKKLVGDRVIDALLFLPRSVLNRRFATEASSELLGEHITIVVVPITYELAARGTRRPSRLFVRDAAGNRIEVLFFSFKPVYIKKLMSCSRICISGKLSTSGNFQFIHPEHIGQALHSTIAKYSKPSLIYKMSAGVSQDLIISTIRNIVRRFQNEKVEDWRPSKPSFIDALVSMHLVLSDENRKQYADRLISDEMLAEQLSLKMANAKEATNNIPISNNGTLMSDLISRLPFKLTGDQIKALEFIKSDFKSQRLMKRLLLGDVGSGKTIVALLSALFAVEQGYQVAVLAPTELLARQHFKTFSKYMENTGVSVEILTANEKGKKRKQILEDLITGRCNILVGTHAVIGDVVVFKKLGYVVIDEQHRFGVNQRLKLIAKANDVHTLSMSATPIPRTLILGVYGDISISEIKEKPQGRLEIKTVSIPSSKTPELIESMKNVIEKGDKVYWVCPLIEESEKLSYSWVLNRYESLKEHFGDNVGFLHGKMKSQEKDDVFSEFADGRKKILVSTTVIEVGVDVPDATVIIIENAEKFGLAQLHQLRGRVGRSDLQSNCILIHGENITPMARSRIETMKQSNDGFYIAEMDLKLRGSGEILGVMQSGTKKFKFFDVTDPSKQDEIYSKMRIASIEATNIIVRNEVDKYELLLKIFKKEENFLEFKKSF